MSVTQVMLRTKLTELLDLLASVDSIINGHMTGFLTNNLWDVAIPPLVRQELDNLPNLKNFMPLYFKFLSDENSVCLNSYPNLKLFLSVPRSTAISKDSFCITPLNQLHNTFSALGVTCERKVEIKEFMSDKKKHEVEEMVPLAEGLSKLKGTQHAIDIGGGKGYLSATMAKQCGLRVLSLDSSSVTICGAEKLEKKMAKSARGNEKEAHKFLRETIAVSRETDFAPILSRSYGARNIKAGLVGLHTCGDLSTICLHQFLRDNVEWIVNVGCCYHLITEEFGQGELRCKADECHDSGFPVSSFLRRQNVQLGRNARMLAAHCLTKLLSGGMSEESARSLYYRALLQVIVKRARGWDLREGRIGRLARKCGSFNQYVRSAMQKLQLDINLTDADIEDIMKEHENEEIKLQVFFLLRIHHAPVVESVILLDRLLFLLEEGIENAHLVPLFCPELSPRNHAIVAWKSCGAFS